MEAVQWGKMGEIVASWFVSPVLGGIGALDLRVIGGIILSWFVTVPVGAILAMVFFFLFKGIFV
jgi:phosphate/sulfate permease